MKQESSKLNESRGSSGVERNINGGLRNLINKLQLSASLNDNIIIFDDISSKKDLENRVIGLCQSVLSNFLSCKDPKIKKMAFINPVNSEIIGPQWVELVQTVTNNFGIDYKIIFEKLDESIHFLPMKQIMSNYLESVKYKQYPHLHLLSCMAELMKCVLEITMM